LDEDPDELVCSCPFLEFLPDGGEGVVEKTHDVLHNLAAKQMFGDAHPSLCQVEGLEGILVFLH